MAALLWMGYSSFVQQTYAQKVIVAKIARTKSMYVSNTFSEQSKF